MILDDQARRILRVGARLVGMWLRHQVDAAQLETARADRERRLRPLRVAVRRLAREIPRAVRQAEASETARRGWQARRVRECFEAMNKINRRFARDMRRLGRSIR